jgi:hypothetical protein
VQSVVSHARESLRYAALHPPAAVARIVDWIAAGSGSAYEWRDDLSAAEQAPNKKPLSPSFGIP